MDDSREVGSINFGILSAEEIIAQSVCKVDKTKKTIEPGTVYDLAMGTTDSTQKCTTCSQITAVCPGHMGHIVLNEPIIHPLFYKRVLSFLCCFCFECGRLLLQKDQIDLDASIPKTRGEARFQKVLKKCKKTNMCCQWTGNGTQTCGREKPAIKFVLADSVYNMVYENSKRVKTSTVLSTEEIKSIFDRICNEDLDTLGLDPEYVHPKNLIITVLPVLPPSGRPFVRADDRICDDDLTNQYIEIIKANDALLADPNKRQKSLATLRFRILTLFNNSQGKAKQINGKPIKAIKERLIGKEGQIRKNMLGKRCNQTGRTVIGPDTSLRIEELAIPPEMAQILTKPVSVTSFNIDHIRSMINKGKIGTLQKPDGTVIDLKFYRRGTRLCSGDIVYRPDGTKYTVESNKELVHEGDKVERKGKLLTNVKPTGRDYTEVDTGWIANVPLQDGDYVILNRQPTLHIGGMMGMRIIIKPGKTIRFNLAITASLNADYDGDESNLHVPATLEAISECKYLSSARFRLISPQSSKANLTIVQDSLLGAYTMTKNNTPIRREQFFDIALRIPFYENIHVDYNEPAQKVSSQWILDRLSHIKEVYRELYILGLLTEEFHSRVSDYVDNPFDSQIDNWIYTGKTLFSLSLPTDFNYSKTNNVSNLEPTVSIYRGVFYAGIIDKTIVKSGHNTIQQVIGKEYCLEAACHFLDCTQFVTNAYLLIRGFSVGMGDCLIPSGSPAKEQIEDAIYRCYMEAEGIKETIKHPLIKESKVNAALNKAKDVGLRLAKESLLPTNNFLNTVFSGSKGDMFNIAQITGLLGQQNLGGQRVPFQLNNGKRTMAHYPFSPVSPQMEYESRGFVSSSFLGGLNPREFYAHARAGREGVIHTAMNTAVSGYMQRRSIKLMEDLKVHYDGTVRDAAGKIYQWIYGEDGLDPVSTVKVGSRQEFCDVRRLVERLNQKHEKQNGLPVTFTKPVPKLSDNKEEGQKKIQQTPVLITPRTPVASERAKETLCEMIQLRGYTLIQDEPLMVAVKPNRMQVLMFFQDQSSFDVKSLTTLIVMMEEVGCLHAIVVYREKVTSTVKTNVKNMQYHHIEFFSEEELQYNPINHILQPRFEKLPEDEALQFRKQYRLKCPCMRQDGAVSRFYDFQPGDVIKITRRKPTGDYICYRIVRAVL